MTEHIVTLCSSCPLGRSGFADDLRLAGFETRVTDCMSGCTRPSTMAFRAPGKTAYLFGDLTAADLVDLQVFAAAYLASADGNLPDARILGDLRLKAIARIPG